MKSHLYLSFIQEKIAALRNALFFPISDSVIKMPVCVVAAAAVDDIGQIWYEIPAPSKKLQELDKTFPAKLDFFKKGADFYLKIVGKAFLVTDPEELSNVYCVDEKIISKALKNEIVLVKLKITHADYFEKKPAAPVSNFSFVKKLQALVGNWPSPKPGNNLLHMKEEYAHGIRIESSYNFF